MTHLTVLVVWCRIEERRKWLMFDDNNIYYDYESIVKDTDPLYEDEDYGDDEYDHDYSNEREFDCYYHNIIDDLDY
jgi:hypothetical protein